MSSYIYAGSGDEDLAEKLRSWLSSQNKSYILVTPKWNSTMYGYFGVREGSGGNPNYIIGGQYSNLVYQYYMDKGEFPEVTETNNRVRVVGRNGGLHGSIALAGWHKEDTAALVDQEMGLAVEPPLTDLPIQPTDQYILEITLPIKATVSMSGILLNGLTPILRPLGWELTGVEVTGNMFRLHMIKLGSPLIIVSLILGVIVFLFGVVPLLTKFFNVQTAQSETTQVEVEQREVDAILGDPDLTPDQKFELLRVLFERNSRVIGDDGGFGFGDITGMLTQIMPMILILAVVSMMPKGK